MILSLPFANLLPNIKNNWSEGPRRRGQSRRPQSPVREGVGLPSGFPLRRRMILSKVLKSARAFRSSKYWAVRKAETFSATAVATTG
jgi:hypothetical protein